MTRSRSLLTFLFLLALMGCAANNRSGSGQVTVSGATLPMLTLTQRNYAAAVAGSADRSVIWSLQEGAEAGTISASGLYTASANAGTYHVIATSVADAARSDTLPITVKGFGTPTSLDLPSYGAAVDRSGTVALADNRAQVRFLAGATTEAVRVGGTPVHVAFDPTGTTAYTGLQTAGTLARLQVHPATELNRVAFGHSIYNLLVDPSGKSVYVTTATGWLFKVHPRTLAKEDSVRLASASNGLAFDPSARLLYVTTISAGILYAIDPATLEKVDSFDVGSGAQRVVVAPSGDSVYVASEGVGGVVVVRPSTGTVTTKPMDGTPYGIALSADGAALYVTLLWSGNIRILDRASLEALTTITVGGTPRNIAVDPNGNFVIVTTESGAVRVQ